MNDGKYSRYIIWLTIATVVVLFIGVLIIKNLPSSGAPLPVITRLPDFRFTERSGQPFGLDDMRGKISIVDFFFTSCPSICPTMSARMAELYQEFTGEPILQFISISVDPDRDSLPVLKEYAQSFGVTDNRWLFLHAPIIQVKELSEKGFMLAADQLPGGHSSRFILVDPNCQIRGYYESLDDSSLVQLDHDLRLLLKSKKR